MRRLVASGGSKPSLDGEKIGKWISLGGGALVVVGAAVFCLSRRRKAQAGVGVSGEGLGLQAVKHKGGMKLTHHRGPMPIRKRIGYIQDMVWTSVQNPQMRQLALAITGNGTRTVQVHDRTFQVQGANCPARDGECETRAIYEWVKKNVRYTGDVAPVKMGSKGPVEGVDLYQSADRSIQFGGGDCDDAAGVNATLLALNGIQAKLRVTAPTRLAEWAHIFSLAGLPKNKPTKWVAVDTTLPGNYYGVEAPNGRHVDFDA